MFYQLIIKLNGNRTIQAGKLGKLNFRAGYYLYTGSAKKNFAERIIRHIKKRKKRHWHLDYLSQHYKIIIVKKISEKRYSECHFHRLSSRKFKGVVKVKNFGSSDCKCGSHLAYIGKNLPLVNSNYFS